MGNGYILKVAQITLYIRNISVLICQKEHQNSQTQDVDHELW